jgi:hypothetical protein
MTTQDFYNFAVLFSLAAPVALVVYIVALIFIKPTKGAFIASLLGGLLMGVLNLLADLTAYNAHWWHYTLKELILHLPIPFYITPILIYGSLVYLLIWRFWTGRLRWLALVLLFGLPIFGIVRDIVSVQIGASYIAWDSGLAIPAVIVMWLVMFYAGYFVFKLLAPREEAAHQVS